MPDPFAPSWQRGLLVAAVAAAGFLLPQETSLVYYPFNDPSPGTLQLQITCASSVTGHTRLYLDTGRGFNEREAITWPVAPGSPPLTYTFPLPDAPLYGFRVAPFENGPGEFTITSLRLVERHGKEVRRFTQDDFASPHHIGTIVPLSAGWKFIVAQTDNPSAPLVLAPPLAPEGMNGRNLQRCLLSWSYLALMLWILLLAAYFALRRGRPWRETLPRAAFLAGIALAFAAVGNRGLITDSVRSARFHPPASQSPTESGSIRAPAGEFRAGHDAKS